MISRLPSILEAIQRIQQKVLTPHDLVDYCLYQIDQYEASLQAWVLVDRDGATAEAERLGDLAGRGTLLGPLHGIPVGIKDIFDVEGWPTRAGSPLREDHCASADAEVVRRLRAAGAIILGKTVTTQFACFDPPVTRNPCNPERTPGGSSSGSAAALRADMCMAALGSQTGGSIARPASYCGVCGFKPTYGVISVEGVFPVSHTLDHVGPLARNVSDLSVVDSVLRSASPCEMQTFTMPTATPILRPLEAFFFERADAEVVDQTRAYLNPLQAGKPIPLPDTFDEVHSHHYRIMAFEAAEVHRLTFQKAPESYGPRIAGLIETGLATTRQDYLQSMRHLANFRESIRTWLSPGEFAVTPTTASPAPGLDSTGDPAFNSPWSYAGLPTVTLPIGDMDGLPLGLQIIGAPHSDATLLATARWCERQQA